MERRRSGFLLGKFPGRLPSRSAKTGEGQAPFRKVVTVRRCAVLAAALAGGCGQHAPSPAVANESVALRTATGGSVIDEQVGSHWALSRPPGPGERLRPLLLQTLRLSSGQPVVISLACAINVHARDQSHRRLDGTERMMLDMRVPQGGLLVSINLAALADTVALERDPDYANRQSDILQKKHPSSIIDTDGPVYQNISLGLGEKNTSSDVSMDNGVLRFPIIGPPMRGPTGEIGAQPYVTLTDMLAARRLSVLVPMKNAKSVALIFSGGNEKVWRFAKTCRDSYRS